MRFNNRTHEFNITELSLYTKQLSDEVYMYQLNPKPEDDISYQDLHYSGRHKTESNNIFAGTEKK